jgi:tetratricopeptide (TPR) repeat protein
VTAIKAWRRWRAARANSRGGEALDRRELKEAASAYRRALDFDPGWSSPWFNLGLVHKWRREWKASLECNEKALALDPANQGACWNLGIAATALGEWAVARRAWAHYGIDLPPGEGPIDADLGLVPIRINPDEAPEVIWCRRLDPARSRIEGVPLPESGRRFHDLLLHDGEPRGSRMSRGREVPVFNEIMVLETSAAGTFDAYVKAASREDSEALEEAFAGADCAAEDWSGNVRLLCAQCSEGRPHEHERATETEAPWAPERRFGIGALDAGRVDELLAAWRSSGEGRAVLSVERVL